MELDVKLTKLASCAGCGAKMGAGTLVKMLEGFKAHSDPRLIVGYDKSDDASVYVLDENTALPKAWTMPPSGKFSGVVMTLLMITAVVGSGGKISLIKELAQTYRTQGKSVFVTITTHMFMEEDTLCTDDADEILIVCGLHSIGQKAKDCCHRLELAKACLGIVDDTVITPAHRRGDTC